MATFYSATEAAVELGVSRQRVSKLCNDGIIESTKVGKFRFPHKTSVEKYKKQLKTRRVRAPKQGMTVPTYLKKALLQSEWVTCI